MALTLSASPEHGGKGPAHAAVAHRPVAHGPAARPRGHSETDLDEGVRADQLYSLRARRHIAAYLRLRLLELRGERLDRAADAIERRLPVDVLLPR